MDIDQRIKEAQAELEATVQKANELAQHRQIVLQDALRLEGELNAYKKIKAEQEKEKKK